MKLSVLTRNLLVHTAALGASHAALASTIGFDALPGSAGDSFSSYAEAGFTVAPLFGNWKEAHAFGAPQPSIYVEDLRSTPFGSIQVTGSAPFTFGSLDLQAYSSAVGFEIAGWRGTTQVFDIASSQAAGGFATIAGTSALAIDRLTIDVSSGGAGSFNVDNIRVSSVPEPGSYGLMLAGLGTLGLFLSRRRRGG